MVESLWLQVYGQQTTMMRGNTADSSVSYDEATVGADQATVTVEKAIAATEETYFGDDEACPEVCPCERIFNLS